MSVAKETQKLLKKIGVAETTYTKGAMPAYSPVTGEKTADASETQKSAICRPSPPEYEQTLDYFSGSCTGTPGCSAG